MTTSIIVCLVPNYKKDFRVITRTGGMFVCTTINIFARESPVPLCSFFQAGDGQAFLHQCISTRFNSFVVMGQANGRRAILKGQFLLGVNLLCTRHRIVCSTKNERFNFESFNHSLRQECLGWAKY